MSDSWDDYADGWDENQDVVVYAEKAFSALTEQVDINNLSILDFGCGTGLLTAKMAQNAKSVHAIDTSNKMIEVLNNKAIDNISTQVVEVSESWLKENNHLLDTFDLITASSVFAFVDDYHQTLLLLKQLLKPDGKIVQWDWQKSQQEPEFGFNQQDIKDGFTQANIELLTISNPFSLKSKQGDAKVIMATGQMN